MKFSFDFIKNRRIYFTISIAIFVVGIISMLTRGIVLDTDFAGGTILTINMGQEFDNKAVEDIVRSVVDGGVTVQKLGPNQDQVMIKMEPLTQEKREEVFEAIRSAYNLKAEDKLGINDVQPVMGEEMRQKGVLATILASIIILVYVAIRFRTMGFSAGVTAILALVHDLMVMVTAYTLFGIPVNGSFVAACLTIVGYSINDTIVIYDRIRENQRLHRKMELSELVNRSINETLTRSVNTSITVLITLVCLYVAGLIYGVTSITEFTFPLIIGSISGVYSTVCICGPLWVMWKEHFGRKAVKGKKLAKA